MNSQSDSFLPTFYTHDAKLSTRQVIEKIYREIDKGIAENLPPGLVLRARIDENSAMPKIPICLASTSKYRRALLDRLGLELTQEKPRVDEDLLKAKHPHLSPMELCRFLGKAKGEAVHAARKNPQQITISGDQLVEFQGKILGKTPTKDAALKQLLMLSGREHSLITSLYLFRGDEVHELLDLTKLEMRSLSEEEILRYIEKDEPFDCAGTYKIEESGIALFSRIKTEDFSAIQGIPLIALQTKLLEFKIPFLAFSKAPADNLKNAPNKKAKPS